MTRTPSIDPADDFVALRLATLRRTPGFLSTSASRERLYRFFARTSALSAQHRVLPGRAQLYLFHDPRAWFGRPCTVVMIDRASGDEDALRFLEAALAEHAAALRSSDALVEVAADDLPLVRLLMAKGLGLDALVQVGAPALARRELARVELPAGLELRPIAPTELDAVVALHQETFTREPARCWFGAYPEHLEAMRRELDGREHQLALIAEGALVGHAGIDVEEHPFWGRVGGIELILRPEYTGRGLARPLYSALLDRLLAAGCDTMKGGTNQPAVLHLGRLMGRPWHTFNLRPGAPFTLEHFLAHRAGAAATY